MGRYDFDRAIERRGTGALKTDALQERYGRTDLLAAWVADMDFSTPDFVMDALKKRLEHPILGYTIEPADYRPAIIDWEKRLHGWEIRPEWISYIPGIVKGIGMAVNVFTSPGDQIAIMPPVYHPFRMVIEANGRRPVDVPLTMDTGGRYRMDLDRLESLSDDVRMLVMSNPHNPGGTVWSGTELTRLAEICMRKGILVISDEIHADMTLWGLKHLPFASVSEAAAQNSITFCAPSKTFNIPGIVSSFSVISNSRIRERFYGWLMANELNDAPLLSHIATIAAYRQGDEWRREMLDYVEQNIRLVEQYAEQHLPGVKALRPDASFLVWLDCRELGMSQKELTDLFVNKARVALNDGSMFGIEGKGFMRLNVATPRANLQCILDRIAEAVR